MSTPGFKVVRNPKGMGVVYRAAPYVLPPNSSARSPVLVGVEHIPVMHDAPGARDFLSLAGVLKAQGLSLETATDGEGNVCIYNRLDVLCYQARGLNGPSYGTEHMHMTTSQDWRRVQLRAAAWIWQFARKHYHVPYDRAVIRPGGSGLALVSKKGHTTHKRVSAAAGYNDRSDPGPGFDFEYVRHAAHFFDKHDSFVIKRHGKRIGA
jgi:hypothetical protein